MKHTPKPQRNLGKQLLVVMCAGAVLAIAGSVYVALHYAQIRNDLQLTSESKEAFPEVSEGNLTERQKKIVGVLRQEFASQPDGTKYSEGAKEPWCADFVSWVFREAGTPFQNPNSGSWRIPGTLTLREYFTSKGVFHTYGDGYTPKTGDVVLYDGNGPHGQHTNIVVRYEGSKLYTVGGNEAGKIHVQVWPLNDSLGVVGFADSSML